MKKILIIEDEENFRLCLTDFLSFQEFQVESAEDGLVGLQLAIEKQPDLIISDLNMPGLDGYEVLQKIRGNLTTATIPLIFLTAQTDANSRQKALKLGANDYLTKLTNLKDLLRTITIHLEPVAEKQP